MMAINSTAYNDYGNTSVYEDSEIPDVEFTDPTSDLSWEKTHLRKNVGNHSIELITSGEDFAKICAASQHPRTHFKTALKRVEMEKKPSVPIGSAGLTTSRLIEVIDTIDRPGNAYSIGNYVNAGTYVHKGENEPGKRIPRAGALAEAGVGKARAEYSMFSAEANGPNAAAMAEANAIGVGAMARAEIGSVAVAAGPLNVSLGLGVDTGVRAGVDGLEVQFLGTGFTLGPRPSISFLGSKIQCVVM